MSFQTPVSVANVLERIHSREYLLPAIQREFVWRQDQILTLLDSLMRGYPIGSFLLWDVKAESASKYSYYNFITDFHELTSPFAAKATVPAGKGIIAVLDGQQRLTALNIALYGSHSERKKGAWISNPDAYVKKQVYLNLVESPDHEELGLAFDLRFLSEAESKLANGQPNKWYKLNDVLSLADGGPSIMKELVDRGIDLATTEPFDRLYALYRAITELKPVNWYLETDQNPDKVLDIFVRVNSGGTTLSYSDLLLSMATNQWETKDAREEVRSLVSELNSHGGRDFAFTKDNVLKTALMISNLPVRFEVSTFTRENMALVESKWDLTRKSLLTATALLKKFGFSSHNLSANSVIVVLAYYMSNLSNQNTYVESGHSAEDRLLIQTWLARTLIKQGIWGSGLDTLLTRLRTAIQEDSGNGFPIVSIEKAMNLVGKSLLFDDAELEDVLSSKYGSPRAFAILSLLYPGLDLSSEFHQDHIFPRSLFRQKSLEKEGVSRELISDYQDRADCLGNLQLLKGQLNIEKQASKPASWLDSEKISDSDRHVYMRENDLDGLPLEFLKFLDFYEARKSRMLVRLKSVLGLSSKID
jgi:hypothetical protein